MGIYTNYANHVSVDDGSYAVRDLYAECGATATFEEMALNLVAENESNYNSIMKAIALDELAYLEENGQEIVYEAGGVSGVLGKIKEFFKKVIEKIRQILHTFVTAMASFIRDDRSFVDKYKKEFSTKWSQVKSDFGFKGYKFTLKDNVPKGSKDAFVTALKKAWEDTVNGGNGNTTFDEMITFDYNAIVAEDVAALKKEVEDIRDNKDEFVEVLRGVVANGFSEDTSNIVIKEGNEFSAAEFSKELFECYRNGESSKQTIEKSELSVAEIVATLTNSEKSETCAKSMCNHVTQACTKIVNDVEKYEKALVKAQSGSEMKASQTKNEDSEKLSYTLAIASAISDMYKTVSSLYTQALGIYLQALKDRSRQSKAIMVKVISGSKKLKESYEYGDNNTSVTEGTSFLSGVTLK